jgi:O-antigen/teichoic acid export membrane protein
MTQSADQTRPRSLGRATRAGVMWGYLRSSVSTLIVLPTTVIMARLLTPEEFGIAAAATFFGQLAARLSSAGMGIALVRVKELRDDHISSVFVINSTLAAISAAALLAAAPFIARFYRTPELAQVLPLVALDFVLAALAMVSQALLTRAMRYKEMAAVSSAEMTISAFAAVALAWWGFSYWSIVLGAVCGSFVKWIWGVRLVGWHLRFRYVPAAARELRSFALGTYTKGLLEYLSQNVDNLVIGRVLGIGALGLYDKAFSSVNRIYKKLTMVGPSVSFRALAIMQDEPERFRRAFGKIIVTSTLVAYGMFAALATMGPHLVVVLFGENWRDSTIPFQLLCVAGALKVPNAYGGAAANARGWIWSNVWRQAAQVACIVGGVYAAAPWGINGASGAVLGATALMFLLTQSMLRSAMGLTWRDLLKPQVPGLSLAAAMVALTWTADVALQRLGGVPPAGILAVQTVTAAVCGLAFVWWCPFAEVRSVVHDILGDVSPRLARRVVRPAVPAEPATLNV